MCEPGYDTQSVFVTSHTVCIRVPSLRFNLHQLRNGATRNLKRDKRLGRLKDLQQTTMLLQIELCKKLGDTHHAVYGHLDQFWIAKLQLSAKKNYHSWKYAFPRPPTNLALWATAPTMEMIGRLVTRLMTWFRNWTPKCHRSKLKISLSGHSKVKHIDEIKSKPIIVPATTTKRSTITV
jgi:hypothetical protein